MLRYIFKLGIRKINGAKIQEIISTLNKGFIYNLFFAFLFSYPITLVIIIKWLNNFAYKTSIVPWVFMVSGLVVGIFSLRIVTWQSWKYSSINPAKSLKRE